MPRLIDCEGAPRDLGFDQGVACGAELGVRFASEPRLQRLLSAAGRSDRRAARVARDVARHFPRQAEAQQGLARGAGVPLSWLETLHADACADPARFGDTLGVAAAGAGAFVARALPHDWLLRRARPEGGIACLEIAPPWFTGALAAVSEAGVAAAVVPLAGEVRRHACAAPAALLVQDALHRTESLVGALDWCLRRPAGGRATLLFADAAGEAAGIAVDGDARRVLRPSEALLVEAGSRTRAAEVAKTLRAAADPARALEGDVVWLDPAARTLRLRSGGEELAESLPSQR